jgi:hypothetical protein
VVRALSASRAFACAIAVIRWGAERLAAISYGLPRAAPVAAAKVRRFSIQAGPAITLGFYRFRRISAMKADAAMMRKRRCDA